MNDFGSILQVCITIGQSAVAKFVRFRSVDLRHKQQKTAKFMKRNGHLDEFNLG